LSTIAGQTFLDNPAKFSITNAHAAQPLAAPSTNLRH
jgi:hypothetical protein